MQPRGRDKDSVDNSPLVSPDGSDLTQQSGYTPVREERSPYADDTRDIVSDARQNASVTAGKAREQASAVADKAVKQADEATTRAGESMEDVASKLRDQARGQGGVAAEVGTKVADTMETTASYLKEHDPPEMLDALERYVREHPLQALAGAIVVGFLIARIVR